MNPTTPTSGVRGPFVGTLIGYTGVSPGPAPKYTVVVNEPDGDKTYENVRPAFWNWDSMGVDEDAARTVLSSGEMGTSTTIICFKHHDRLIALFIPAPFVQECS